MTKPSEDPFEGLQRAFHEPKRLAIMSALAGSPLQELSFSDLKSTCDLTDGNLNRHLKTLEEAGAVAFRKTGGPGRPQTIISLTGGGRQHFIRYLAVLEEVLKRAAAAAAKMPGAPAQGPSSGRGLKIASSTGTFS